MKSFTFLALLGAASAFRAGPQRLIPPPVEMDEAHLAMKDAASFSTLRNKPANADAAAPVLGEFFYEQLLDHAHPKLGTFQQKVFYNSEFWAGPGSPIIFFTPGEIEAGPYGGYLTNRTYPGRLAQEMKGAVVMVEHRYWGESSPYQDLTTKNMQYLTLKNSIADYVRFAANAEFPFDKAGSKAAKAPWVFTGGSYSGSMAAWTEATSPGTFWAYHSSSAPVQAISDYWQYFVPVEHGMPKNCSRDLRNVINYIDNRLKRGSQKEQYDLKKRFGLEKLQNDDFGQAIEWGPWEWQSNSFTTGYSEFYKFCDAIEGVGEYASVTETEVSVGAVGEGGPGKNQGRKPPKGPGSKPEKPGHPDAVAIETSIQGYATWVKQSLIPEFCQYYGYEDPMTTDCMDTHNKDNLLFTDRAVYNSIDRQWQWMLCNEPFGWWQNGAPAGTKSIVSRNVNTKYWTRQCPLFFPAEVADGKTYTYGMAKGKTERQFNAYTGGWKPRRSQRLLYVNGEFDPWRTAGVSSEFRPGGPLKSTKDVPVNIVPGGFHCSDMTMRNAEANPGVEAVVAHNVRIIKGWTADWYKQKKTRQPW